MLFPKIEILVFLMEKITPYMNVQYNCTFRYSFALLRSNRLLAQYLLSPLTYFFLFLKKYLKSPF